MVHVLIGFWVVLTPCNTCRYYGLSSMTYAHTLPVNYCQFLKNATDNFKKLIKYLTNIINLKHSVFIGKIKLHYCWVNTARGTPLEKWGGRSFCLNCAHYFFFFWNHLVCKNIFFALHECFFLHFPHAGIFFKNPCPFLVVCP